MDYNTNNTIVIVVSTNNNGGISYPAEQNFIDQYINSVKNTPNDWIYISTDGKSMLLNDLAIKICSFILYNQAKNNTFTDFITKINQENKHVLIYRHNTNNQTPTCDVLRNQFNKLIDCIPFSHGTSEALSFMKRFVCNGADYTKEFGILIQEYLKKKSKPHLIALSILCQGYLAAHGGNGLKTWDSLPSELRDKVKANKNMTEGQGWWEPAFANVFEKKKIKKDAAFQQTTIYSELTSSGKDCEKNKGKINTLFDAIKGLNGKDSADTDKVIAAYDCIKEILKGKS